MDTTLIALPLLRMRYAKVRVLKAYLQWEILAPPCQCDRVVAVASK